VINNTEIESIMIHVGEDSVVTFVLSSDASLKSTNGGNRREVLNAFKKSGVSDRIRQQKVEPAQIIVLGHEQEFVEV